MATPTGPTHLTLGEEVGVFLAGSLGWLQPLHSAARRRGLVLDAHFNFGAPKGTDKHNLTRPNYLELASTMCFGDQ